MGDSEDINLKSKLLKSLVHNHSMRVCGEESIGQIPIYIGEEDKRASSSSKKNRPKDDVLHLIQVNNQLTKLQAELNQHLSEFKDSHWRLTSLNDAFIEDDINRMQELLASEYHVESQGWSNTEIRLESVNRLQEERITFESLVDRLNEKIGQYDRLLSEHPGSEFDKELTSKYSKEIEELKASSENANVDFDVALLQVLDKGINEGSTNLVLVKKEIDKTYAEEYARVTKDGLVNPFPSVGKISENFNQMAADEKTKEPNTPEGFEIDRPTPDAPSL